VKCPLQSSRGFVLALSTPLLTRMAAGPAALVVLALVSYVLAQSTSTTLPPLQWINLSSSLSGSNQPPPLKDASIGYDDNTCVQPIRRTSCGLTIFSSRSIIIFGGESESGIPQSQTYMYALTAYIYTSPDERASIVSTSILSHGRSPVLPVG
jgi:hypothetical protein